MTDCPDNTAFSDSNGIYLTSRASFWPRKYEKHLQARRPSLSCKRHAADRRILNGLYCVDAMGRNESSRGGGRFGYLP